MVGRCIPYWNSRFLRGYVSFSGCNHFRLRTWCWLCVACTWKVKELCVSIHGCLPNSRVHFFSRYIAHTFSTLLTIECHFKGYSTKKSLGCSPFHGGKWRFFFFGIGIPYCINTCFDYGGDYWLLLARRINQLMLMAEILHHLRYI